MRDEAGHTPQDSDRGDRGGGHPGEAPVGREQATPNPLIKEEGQAKRGRPAHKHRSGATTEPGRDPPPAHRTQPQRAKPYRGWQDALRRAIRLLEPSRLAGGFGNLDGREKTRMRGATAVEDAEIYFEHRTRFLGRPDGLWRDALMSLVPRLQDNPTRDEDGWPNVFTAEAFHEEGPFLKIKVKPANAKP